MEHGRYGVVDVSRKHETTLQVGTKRDGEETVRREGGWGSPPANQSQKLDATGNDNSHNSLVGAGPGWARTVVNPGSVKLESRQVEGIIPNVARNTRVRET